MDYSNLKTRLKNDLKWLGAFESTAGSDRMDSAILSAALKIWTAKAWPWKYSSTTLTLTPGSKGPYDPPSDFSGISITQSANLFLYKDIQTLYAIKDTETERFDAYFDEQENKIYLAHPTEEASLTLYYRPEFDNAVANISTTLTNFPEELYEVFEMLVPAHILNEPDTLSQRRELMNEGMALIENVYSDYRRHVRRPKNSVPRGLNGLSYDGIAEAETLVPRYSQIRRW